MHVIYLKFLSPQTFSLTYSLKLFQIIYFVVSTTFFLFTLNNGKSDHSLIHDQAIKRNGFNTEWKSQITLHCFFKELFWYKAACAVNWVLNPLLFLSWSLIKIIIIIHVCILQFFFFLGASKTVILKGTVWQTSTSAQNHWVKRFVWGNRHFNYTLICLGNLNANYHQNFQVIICLE